jgi:hypothetical protein
VSKPAQNRIRKFGFSTGFIGLAIGLIGLTTGFTDLTASFIADLDLS